MHVHKFSWVFAVSLVSLIFIVPTQSEPVPPKNIGTNGRVSYGGSANLLFSTDFSGMTIGTSQYGYPCLTKKGLSRGYLGIDSEGKAIENYFYSEVPSSNTFWIDDTTSSAASRQYGNMAPSSGHNGQRYVIGMKAIAQGGGVYRNEFNLPHVEKWLPRTNAYYLSVWLYFPATWFLPSQDWYSLAVPLQGESGDYLPISELHIDNYQGQYEMNLQYGTPGGGGINEKWIVNNVPNFHPLFGQWFNLKMYVLSSPTAGRIVVWIDEQVISDTDIDVPRDHPHCYPLPTAGSPPWAWLVTVAKEYTDNLPSGGLQMWVSDLQIYDDIPL